MQVANDSSQGPQWDKCLYSIRLIHSCLVYTEELS